MKLQNDDIYLISDDSSIYEVDAECMKRKKNGENDCQSEKEKE